jgi:hypothetical protein
MLAVIAAPAISAAIRKTRSIKWLSCLPGSIEGHRIADATCSAMI